MWNVPLIAPIFLKTSLVFPILFFSSVSLPCSFKKTFISLPAILWNSAFSWVYFSLSPLPFSSLLSSVQFSRSIVCDSLWPHELQHARFPCPAPTPGACSNSCPSSQWCHPTISSTVVPFSSCRLSFLASGSFPMSHFFTSSSQSIGVSASTSVLPVNIQDWFTLGWTGWISLLAKGLSRVFSNTMVQKHPFLGAQLSLQPNCHIHPQICRRHHT